MLHLIVQAAERLLPAPIHRALLPAAHVIRHRWRRWRAAPIAGVSVIVTNQAGDVLLLRHSYGPDNWALPGGGIKPGEDIAECARREVREELGIRITQIEPLDAIEETLSGSPHTAHLFAAMTGAVPVPDRREVLEARFFPPHALPANLGEVSLRRIEIWRRCGAPSGAS